MKRRRKRAALALLRLFRPPLSLSSLASNSFSPSLLCSFRRREHEKTSALIQTRLSLFYIGGFSLYLNRDGKALAAKPLDPTAAAAAAAPLPPPLLTPLRSTSCSGLITLGPLPPGTCVTFDATEAGVSFVPGRGAGVLLWVRISGRGTTEPLAFLPTVTRTLEPSSRKRQETRTGARVTGSTRRTLE